MKYKIGDKMRLCLPGHVYESYNGEIVYIDSDRNIAEVFIPSNVAEVYQFDMSTGIDVKGAAHGIYQKY